MDFKFIDTGWAKIFEEISARNSNEYKFITPFIQLNTIKTILRNRKNLQFKLITRFNLSDFFDGVSNLDAIEYILKRGDEIKGLKNLHSKLYVFDSREAILSSANLTQAALLKNFEFGMHTSSPEAISSLESYFDNLWEKIPSTLNYQQIEKWRKEIDSEAKKGKNSYENRDLKDYGHSLKNTQKTGSEKYFSNLKNEKQYFIKFFGEGNNRANRDMHILEEIERSGCHWACTYPTNKRPRKVRDGAIMFMGRLSSNPNDILIYGYATGKSYKDGRDDATQYDLKIRSWKEKWPRYIRVHDAHFINGTLKDGISMNELMEKFGYNSFASTLRNKIKEDGNINPRTAYMQQASVELTEDAASWLKDTIDTKLSYYGQISNSILSKIE
jgi:HKD family nuclease